MFDERLFFGFDDLDFGLRLGAAGYACSPTASCGIASAPDRAPRRDAAAVVGLDGPSWRRYYSTRNMIYILRNQGHRRGVARLVARSAGEADREPAAAPDWWRPATSPLNTRAIADASVLGVTVS